MFYRLRWLAFAFLCVILAGLGAYLIDYAQRQTPTVPTPPQVVTRPAPPPKKPQPPLIPGTQLTEVAIDLDLSKEDRPVDPVVYFEPPDMYGNDSFERVTGLLRREMYRQAVVMAAREGLGLNPRDALLGEEPPNGLSKGNHFRVNPRFAQTRKSDVKIECGPADARQLVWHATGIVLQELENETHLQALTAAESLSRSEFIKALKKSGLRGTPIAVTPDIAIPAETEARLGKMTFPDQYAALRELHTLVRVKGESPSTLTALTRAYANLGMLTDRQLDGMTWVFKARSMLYAERLRVRDSDSPTGLWARGYAAALTGLHKIALDDLAAAEKVRGTHPVPVWATLANDLCRFDTARLEAAASAGGPLADTAAVFHFMTLENPNDMPRLMTAGKTLLTRIPDCYRVHEAIEELMVVGMEFPSPKRGLEVFTETFSTRVKSMPGLPNKVATDSPEAEIIKALEDAGRERAEMVEPTWSTLGRFARETRFAQVDRRMQFIAFSLAGDGTETLDALRPLIAHHPLAPLLKAYTLDPSHQRAELEEWLASTRPPELTCRHTGFFQALAELGEKARFPFTYISSQHGDNLYFDRYFLMRRPQPNVNYSPMAKKLYDSSPYSPLARSLLIRDDWAFASTFANAWESEAQHAEVFSALARQSTMRGDYAAAERQASAAVKFSPQLEAYQALAEVRRAKGDSDGYVTTLNEYLKAPDHGLKHTRAQVNIADHYLVRKEYDKARPYAEAAASSWAAWGMECAVRCAEGRGDWAEAERILQNLIERYPSSHFLWYHWCLRTGRGDLAASQALVEKHLAGIGQPRSADDAMITAVMHSASGRTAKAAEFFQKSFELQNEEFFAYAALTDYDAVHDNINRDKILTRLELFRRDYVPLYTFIRSWLAKNPTAAPPTRDEIEVALKPMKPNFRLNAYYIVGRLLQNRGQKELAAHYFREAVPHPPENTRIAPVLCALALREMGKK